MPINLLPANRLKALAAHRRVHLWCWLLAPTTLLLCAGVVYASTLQGPDQADLERLEAQRARLTVCERQVEQIKRRTRALESDVQSARRISEYPDWSIVLERIALARGNDVVLESASIGPAKQDRGESGKKSRHPASYQVDISGAGASQTAVSEFVARLEEIGLFASVRQNDTRARQVGPTSAVGFSLTCNIGAKPPSDREAQR